MNVVSYRKKPVVIQAVKLEKDNSQIAAEWCEGKVLRFPTGRNEPYGIEIPALEGTMQANLGDFIIKGVKGEFYPCKPDVFKLTYEKT